MHGAPARTGESARPRLELEDLGALDDAGQLAVSEFSLAVRAGEIVGIAGVSGNGQRQLVEVLAGQRGAESGEICAGRGLSRPARRDAPPKLSVLPEEPLKNACVARMSVAENIVFREFDRAPFAGGNVAPHAADLARAENDAAAGGGFDDVSTFSRMRQECMNRLSKPMPSAISPSQSKWLWMRESSPQTVRKYNARGGTAMFMIVSIAWR